MKSYSKKIFYVCGWINGSDYDDGKAPDLISTVAAFSESEAKRIAAPKFGERCEVVEAS